MFGRNQHNTVGEGNDTPLQYSCLENPMDGGAWWASVHAVAGSQTWLSDFTFTFHFHALEKEMATHSSVLAWRISGTGEPGGLLCMGSHRVGHDWSNLAAATQYCNTIIHQLKIKFLKSHYTWNSLFPPMDSLFILAPPNSFSSIKQPSSPSVFGLVYFSVDLHVLNCHPLLFLSKSIFTGKTTDFLIVLGQLCQSLWLCGSQ